MVDSLKIWPHGQIIIEITQVNFTPGDVVVGFIHIKLDKDYPGNVLLLRFKGREYLSMNEDEIINGKRIKKIQSNRYDSHETKVDVHIWPTSYAPIGQYTFPFEMHLPPDVASSFYYNSNNIFANIWYKIHAAIRPKNQNNPVLKTSKTIMISNSNAISNRQPDSKGSHIVYKCGSCLRGGAIKITARTQKESYTANENLDIFFDIDCTESKVHCETIELVLKQELELETPRKNVIKLFKVVSQIFPNINVSAGSQKSGIILSLQLPPEEPYYFSNNVKAKIYEGDKYTISSSTDGHIIASKFFVEVNLVTGALFPKPFKVFIMPVDIAGLALGISKTIGLPEKWDPQVAKVNLSSIQHKENLNDNLENLGGKLPLMNNI